MKNRIHRHAWCCLLAVIILTALAALSAQRPIPRASAAPLAAPAPLSVPAPFNNEGVSPDATPTVANFDGGGRSYSNEALTAAGLIPGQSVTFGSYTFQWVNPTAGASDNWLQAEQVIPLTTRASSLAFLGASAGGAATGAGYVRYTDGSAQAFTLTFSDWTLGGGASPLSPGNTIAATSSYRNTPTGKDLVKTYVFEATLTLTAGKTIADVTLPRTVNQGALHVFAIAAASNATSATIEGVSNDTTPTSANLDGGGRSYSNNALAAAGLGSGAHLPIYGFSAQWPTIAAGAHDTWGTYGAVIPLSGSGATLEIVGAAVGGASSGAATITYADGSTQTATLAFSDWTLGGGMLQRLPSNYPVATMPYRNTPTGKQLINTYLFATMLGLVPGKPLKSLTLPVAHTGGRIVVFAAAPGSASIPGNLAAISADTTPTSANFDGGGRSYSNNALAAAGLPSGALVSIGGYQFQWPTNAANTADAWQPTGQTLPVISSAASLAFLGAAGGGSSSGVVTITYTDGSTQTATLAFNDWTLGGGGQPLLSGASVAAKAAYRNTPTGAEQVTTYVFLTTIALTPGKTAQSVTLPTTLTGGGLAVFAISGVASTGSSASNSWPTYLGDPGHTSYNAAETTLTPANAAQLHLKWTAHAHQAISAQPIMGNGLLYWGSWDGLLHATNASGVDTWATNIGQQTVATCNPATAGVAGAATLGSIGGVPALFVGGGDNTMYALNATTGAILWSTTFTTSTDYFIWDSPVVYNGSLYIGASSFGDCPNAIGKVYRLDLTTGAIQNTLPLTNASCTGDGVWGSPTIDVATGVLYLVTGNSCPGDPNGVAIIALSSGDLSLIDRWQVTPVAADSDFGSTPTLFTATINGVTRKMIGVANKNGSYYAFDRTNLSAGPLWSAQLAVGGECPDCGDGSISPSAWNGSTLYIAAGKTTINGVACASTISAVNPATGAFLWRQCVAAGPILGAVVASPGLLVVDAKTTVYVLDATTGATLFNYADTSQYSYFYAAPAILNGVVYAPNADGALYAFSL